MGNQYFKKIFKKKINEVGLVGLTYKEDISILKNSPAIKLVRNLMKKIFIITMKN